MASRGSKAVLLTGAGGGIGSAAVEAFAGRGYRVYAGVRRLESAPRFGHADVVPVELDVTDPASVRRALDAVAAERGSAGLQVLVNNAGVIVQGPLELVPDAELHRQFDINVYGPHRVLAAALPLLRAGHGRVINISAASARTAMPYLGPISASKAALESLSQAARIELAPWGIPVSVVEPGAVETTIFAKADATAREALALADLDRVALYRDQLAAVGDALAKQKTGSTHSVVRTIVRAAEARRPKECYVASADARMLRLLAHLPFRLRDRVLAGALGLSRVPRAAGAAR
ncbi:SDR family NAD(P)-dependent oxidoreductase [Nocardia beijingensis]|uniref:SDR family NAD(P)-dependent oxidoreductase n=1 Tax=Nocardia beijingensis TaxID=95162 RepID=UPI00189461A7|nr:SDR family NAD(P)-dependent oxidoreductase [Nocardia beijingensis]MBF6465184.1 SDR family NAD(P)-dependent oxidoreductase [Nocardia beijingensis]